MKLPGEVSEKLLQKSDVLFISIGYTLFVRTVSVYLSAAVLFDGFQVLRIIAT